MAEGWILCAQVDMQTDTLYPPFSSGTPRIRQGELVLPAYQSVAMPQGWARQTIERARLLLYDLQNGMMNSQQIPFWRRSGSDHRPAVAGPAAINREEGG